MQGLYHIFELMNKDIRPQPGFQEQALSTSADIAVLGGSAGGGKTMALLLEGSRNVKVKAFTATIFRRTSPQITAPGGLWDASNEIYPYIGAKPREHRLEWLFPGGSRIAFRAIQHEKDLNQWQGSEIALIGFDELTHFTKSMFIYLLSRNRSMCGVKPYIRATCNPDPSSWVAEFIKWWIGDDGYPIPERCGKLRYMTNMGGTFIWGNTWQEVLEKCPELQIDADRTGIAVKELIKSVTFIPGSIYDNKRLLEKNPAYLSNLHALDPEEKKRLLDGNWKISLDGMEIFNYEQVDHIFENYVDKTQVKKRYITCDAARFGRDFCVIMVWENWEVIEIHIYKKSDTVDVVNKIEDLRRKYLISKLNVLIDQDGVGGNVVAKGNYKGFSGGAAARKDPETRIKENYKNLKTQCYYRFAELRVNMGLVQINVNTDCCFIYDYSSEKGIRSTKIKVGKEVLDVRDLIKQDLRAMKRKEPDNEGKKMMNSKEEQKEILSRSPDFADTLMMRESFELLGESGSMKRKK